MSLSTEGLTLAEPKVVRFTGDLDSETADHCRRALGDATSAGTVVIDLSEVPFMDSAGLGALIGGIRRIRECGGDVRIASPRPVVGRLLEVSGASRIVEVVTP